MKRLKLVVLISLLALLAACASPKYNYMPAQMNISEPPINSVVTSQVGDVMLRQGIYTEHDVIYLDHDVDSGWAYTLKPGYYYKQGDDETAEYYMPRGEEGGAVDKAALADPWKSIMAKKEEPVLCVVTVFNAYVCSGNTTFERRKKSIATQNAFQQTLIYSGRFGNKINIGYREFSNNLARPAFNNNVEYDLSESSIIGYKGARLEVIEATNQTIKYKILSNFNKILY